MKYQNVFITGAGGMLGSYVCSAFKDCNVLASDIVQGENLEYVDVRDFDQCENYAKKHKADLIINLAAMTDLEECQLNGDRCYATNTIGAFHLQKIAADMNAAYVFISTAGVFGGEKDVFTDTDATNPLSVYAKSKVYAEEHLRSYFDHTKTWIFRAGWMMGGRGKDKKFVSKLLKQVINGSTELNVVDDKAGTPTYTYDFAQSIKRHLDEDLQPGLYNMVCQGDATRYDVALEIKRLLNLDVKINKVSSDVFAESYFAPRPASEKLQNYLLEKQSRNYMRDWKTCLEEYLLKDWQFTIGDLGSNQ